MIVLTWSVTADLWCSSVEALGVDLVKFFSEIFSASFPLSSVIAVSLFHQSRKGLCHPEHLYSPSFITMNKFTPPANTAGICLISALALCLN